MSTDTPNPPAVGSRWVDTEGLDGEITVTGHDKGCYVLAQRYPLDEELYINWQHFGHRYQPAEEARGV